MLLTAIGVAAFTYATQSKNKSSENDDDDAATATDGLPPAKPLEPKVLEGLRAIDLLPIERSLALFEAPSATITFFDGAPSVAVACLRARVKEIVASNPWLGGCLAKRDGKVSLLYDEDGVLVHPQVFYSFAPGAIPLARSSAYESLGDVFAGHDVVVRCNADLVGRDLPLFRVAVIPDAAAPDSRFALVASLSHVAGDGHTFHRIFKMLAADAAVAALDPVRRPEYGDAVVDLCGPNEAFYVSRISRSPLWAAPGQRNGRKIVRAAFFVNEQWVEGQKEACAKKERMEEARRMFDSDRDLKGTTGGRLAGVEEAEHDGDDIETELADNNENTDAADNAALPRATLSLEKYGMPKSGFKVSYASHQAAPHLTTNDVVASWFFQSVHATVGLVPYTLRGADRSPTITDDDAGNYAMAIPLAPEDYATPTLMRHARKTGRRAHKHIPLPSHGRDSLYAVCVDWRNIGLKRGGLTLGPPDDEDSSRRCTQVLHLPCYQGRALDFIPKSFSSIHLFNAGPQGEPACTVIAAEEDMKRILKSDIVKAVINESSSMRGNDEGDDALECAMQEAKQGLKASKYADFVDPSALTQLLGDDY